MHKIGISVYFILANQKRGGKQRAQIRLKP
ncbi:uncharacterized protein METZ01_LOCUS455503 [marine metagenome]|uniref:Uncharacterized protein n=1 Tax=marine metagenome TaxID=408172 RepID=A0A383A522_9ZZZZ